MLKKITKISLLSIVLFGFCASFFANSARALGASSYNSDIAQKVVSRCDLIRDYLAQTARINELAARQNKVRGWEYILRQLEITGQSYAKFGESTSGLSSEVATLKQQLEQFKADFELYDGAFTKLNAIDCSKQPENFWNSLENVRALRTGIALAADNFNLRLDALLKNEEAKW